MPLRLRSLLQRSAAMLLLVGLGNPGARHAGNRHNVGFMAVDRIAQAHGFGAWRSRFQGLAAEGRVGGGRVLALKPMTWMNDSGRSVGAALRFHRLAPAAVVVCHDEIDLAPGRLRLQAGGGAAGHNGVRSVAAHVGAGFRRLRIGVGHPGHRDRVHGHVLSDFARADRAWLEAELDAVANSFPHLVAGRDGAFMSDVAAALRPPRGAPPPAAAGQTPEPAPGGA